MPPASAARGSGIYAAALCLLFAGGAKADFFDAAKWGDVKLMQQYLEQGVDINARDASRMGSTALHYAAGAQKAEAVVFLLDRGADINALDDYGQTPLHGAATLMEPDIALLLMERGADALQGPRFRSHAAADPHRGGAALL